MMKDDHTTLVIMSKELSSNGSLGLTFKSCTIYSVRTCKNRNCKDFAQFIECINIISRTALLVTPFVSNVCDMCPI